MFELFWRAAAFVVSRRPIADALIARAQRTPYFNLPGYMDRHWLFNGYSADQSLSTAERHASKRWPRLPSIRIHHILREDLAGHPHDHPWNARTIVLCGAYCERRWWQIGGGANWYSTVHYRLPGDTAPLRAGQYHHIEGVTPGGVFTLFITFDHVDDWGFLVGGEKVPHREYEARYPARLDAPA